MEEKNTYLNMDHFYKFPSFIVIIIEIFFRGMTKKQIYVVNRNSSKVTPQKS